MTIYSPFRESEILSWDRLGNFILNVWTVVQQYSSSFLQVRFPGWERVINHHVKQGCYHIKHLEGKWILGAMLVFYTAAPQEGFQKDKIYQYLSSLSGPRGSGNISRFPFATWFFKRFHFLLNLRLSSLEVKTFSEEFYRGLFNWFMW